VSTSDPAPPPSTGAVAVALSELLRVPALSGAKVLAGASGLDREVEHLNVMEVPDIRHWVKPREFLLTSSYPLRDDPEELTALVVDLDAAGLAGLGIKLGRYLEALPDAVLEVADARGFPIVQLPPGVTFDEILTEALTVILNRHAEKLARSERIHRAFLQTVLRGEGLDEIVGDLAELLDDPAVIVSPQGQVLASARLDELGLDPADPLVLDDEHGLVRSGGREVACVAVPVSAGARLYGHVVALAADDPPTDDLMALENAATVAALALTKQREVQAVEDKYRSDLMHDLLRGVEDPDDARRRAGRFGWDVDRPLVVMVARRDDPAEAGTGDEVSRHAPLAGALRQLVAGRDPGAAVVDFSDEVVVLTAAFDPSDGRDRATDLARGFAREASRALDASVSIGVSRPAEDLAAVPRGYRQASRALEIGHRIEGRSAVTGFDDLGAYRLLSLVEDPDELRAFAQDVLGPLYGDDDEAADLRATLQAWLDARGNVAEVSRQLHFHYHTVRYRIDKLEGIVGPFTSDPRLRLDLELALLVRSMRGLGHRP
jgi:PucR family transcriptional regulator, purine catabolism regulatory protein